jgi:hypothetical protein
MVRSNTVKEVLHQHSSNSIQWWLFSYFVLMFQHWRLCSIEEICFGTDIGSISTAKLSDTDILVLFLGAGAQPRHFF